MKTQELIATAHALPYQEKISQLSQVFLSSQDVRPSSRDTYSRALSAFFYWVGEQGLELGELARAEVVAYKEYLLSSGKSPLTVGSYITTVRRFYEWAEAHKLYPNIAKGVRNPKRKQQFKKGALAPEEAKSLLSYFEGRVEEEVTEEALRDLALINLLLRAGLRTVEAVRANREDMVVKRGKRVLLVHGKGRDEKDEFVILSDKTVNPILSYLEARGSARASEPLFVSASNRNKGQRLTTRSISRIAKEGLRAIGLDNRQFTAHSLRHTTATSLRRAGASMEDIQDTLRHANPATTQIYLKTFKEEYRLERGAEQLLDNVF